MASTGHSARDPAQQDIFTSTPMNASKFSHFDDDDSVYTTSSPAQAKRILEAHIADTQRRIEDASKLGVSLVEQRRQLADRLNEVEREQGANEMGPELKAKLLELEKAYNEIGRESAKSFLPRSRYVSGASVDGIPSPAKIHVPATRKQRNQSTTQFNDIELATELSQSLVTELRDTRETVRIREEALRDANDQIIRLQADVEGLHQRLRSLDDDEEKFKDATWTLETHVQDLSSQLREALAREERLTKTLNATKAEKSTSEREFEDLKAAHYQLTDEHSTFQKQHDTDLSGLQRTLESREKEQELMQRKIDELTSQNQDLAKAVAYRVRTDNEQAGDDSEYVSFSEDVERSSPDVSPPASPSKQTPARHGGLEHETMRSSLAHLQKRYQALQSNIHREKTEKIELRRMLQDARDELERHDKDGGNGPNSSKRGRPGTAKDSFKRPFKADKLGNAKAASEEVWEDYDGSPSRRPVGDRAASAMSTTETSDAYATANERDTTTDSDAFATGQESMNNSSDELTETEDGPAKHVKRMASASSGLRRQSFQSTASASDDDETVYDVATPTSNVQRFRGSRFGRTDTVRASQSPGFRDSPASFVSNNSNQSGPRSNMNLAAELQDFDDSSTIASTPTRSIASREASPLQTRAPPVPSIPSAFAASPPAHAETKDMGTSTDETGSPKRLADTAGAFATGGVMGGLAGALFGKAPSKGSEERDGPASQAPAAPAMPQPSPAEIDARVEERVREQLATIEAARPAEIDALVSKRVQEEIDSFKASQPKAPSQQEIDELVQSQAKVIAAASRPRQSDIDALVEQRALVIAAAQKPKQAEVDALVEQRAAVLAAQQRPQQDEIDALVEKRAVEIAEAQKPKQADIDALVEKRASALAEAQKPKAGEVDALVEQRAKAIAAGLQPKEADINALVEQRAKQIATDMQPKEEAIDALVEQRAKTLAAQSQPKQAEIDALVERRAQQLAEQSRPQQAEIDRLVEARAAALAAEAQPSQAEIDALIDAKAKELSAQAQPSQADIDALVEERARAMAAELAASATRDAVVSKTPTHVVVNQLMQKAHSDSTPSSMKTDEASSPEEDTAGRSPFRVALFKSKNTGLDTPESDDPFRESPLSVSSVGASTISGRGSSIAENPTRALSGGDGRLSSRSPLQAVSGNTSSGKAGLPHYSPQRRSVADEGTQTAVSADLIDQLIKDRNKRADTKVPASPRSTAASSSRSSPSATRVPEGAYIRRPGSANSLRHDSKQYPPLPPDHKEAIAAASSGSRTPSMIATAMPPPPIPAYGPNRPQNGHRPRTPSGSYQQHPAYQPSPAAKAPSSGRQRTSSVIRVGDQHTRRSSVSSFASEVDQRFDMTRSVYPEGVDKGVTDPRMIAAITQTMIGEFLWKYTRKAGRADHSDNRHRRFFWIHPYTRTLYWSTADPSRAGKDELKAKSVAIEAVRVVADDNPLPPGLHTKSLIIVTPGRSIKLTAPTSSRHETWLNALSFLLLRSNEPQGPDTSYSNTHDRTSTMTSQQSDDLADFDPYARSTSRMTSRSQQSVAARLAHAPSPRLTHTPSVSSRRGAAHTHGSATPADASTGEFKKPALPTKKPEDRKSSVASRLSLSNLTRRGREQSRAADEERRRQQAEAEQLSMPLPDEPEHDVETDGPLPDHYPEHHHSRRQTGNIENVRACCDGKHDVASLPHRSTSRSASQASRRSFSLRGTRREH